MYSECQPVLWLDSIVQWVPIVSYFAPTTDMAHLLNHAHYDLTTLEASDPFN